MKTVYRGLTQMSADEHGSGISSRHSAFGTRPVQNQQTNHALNLSTVQLVQIFHCWAMDVCLKTRDSRANRQTPILLVGEFSGCPISHIWLDLSDPEGIIEQGFPDIIYERLPTTLDSMRAQHLPVFVCCHGGFRLYISYHR